MQLDPKLSAMARDQAQTLMQEADALRREAEVLDQRALATARVWMFGLNLNTREVYASGCPLGTEGCPGPGCGPQPGGSCKSPNAPRHVDMGA